MTLSYLCGEVHAVYNRWIFCVFSMQQTDCLPRLLKKVLNKYAKVLRSICFLCCFVTIFLRISYQKMLSAIHRVYRLEIRTVI